MIDWNQHLLRLKSQAENRKPGPRSYTEEQIVPYLPRFRWDNEKLNEQMGLFWMYVHRFSKYDTIYELKRTLDWCASKDLHVRQVVKTLSSQIKRRRDRTQ